MYREKYEALFHNRKMDDFYAEQLLDCIKNFYEYVAQVVLMEASGSVNQIVLAGEPKQIGAERMRLDNNRTNAHEAAIASTKMLNRICEQFGEPLFFEGDVGQRKQVAAFCLDVVDEFFHAGQGGLNDIY